MLRFFEIYLMYLTQWQVAWKIKVVTSEQSVEHPFLYPCWTTLLLDMLVDKCCTYVLLKNEKSQSNPDWGGMKTLAELNCTVCRTTSRSVYTILGFLIYRILIRLSFRFWKRSMLVQDCRRRYLVTLPNVVYQVIVRGHSFALDLACQNVVT